MKDISKYFRGLLFICCFLSFLTGCVDCEYFAEQFKEKSYYFKIEKKNNETRFTIFEGRNKNNEEEKFQEVGFSDMYDVASIGDTLIKPKESLEIKIVKPDTTLIFYYKCF